ncbi:2-hydroxychromene-2-carboxylate isomerase [bacterium]|nr:2-hydroxychromene-2-carboxylate isomerase [bacterium]
MPRSLEFFYDVISPTAYLASKQLPAIAERTGAKLVYRPFFLGGVMQATGNRPPATVPAKGKWMQADLQRYAKRYGVVLGSNPHFPMMNTLPVQRASIVLRQRADFPAFLAAVFDAVWREGANIADRETLTAIVSGAGFDAGAFWAAAEDPANKEALKAATEEAVARGAFGAPTFFVGDEMFFGQDRLDFVEEALKAA